MMQKCAKFACADTLKKLVMFLCTPFANCCIDSDWALEITLHSLSARQVPPCADFT